MRTEKIALITGATSGIGKSLSIALAEKQIKVIAVGRNSRELLNISSLYPDIIDTIRVDFLVPTYMEEIYDRLLSYKKIDFLVHCAGVTIPYNLTDMPLKILRDHFSINFEPAFSLTQYLLPSLSNGRVLFISSGLANRPGRMQPGYSMSKTCLKSLYHCWKEELQSRHIFLGYVELGPVDTPMHESILKSPNLKPEDINYFLSLREKMLTLDKAVEYIENLLLVKSNEEFFSQEWIFRK